MGKGAGRDGGVHRDEILRDPPARSNTSFFLSLPLASTLIKVKAFCNLSLFSAEKGALDVFFYHSESTNFSDNNYFLLLGSQTQDTLRITLTTWDTVSNIAFPPSINDK